MKGIDLIYLDVSFVTRFYEDQRNERIPIKTVKTSDLSGNISAGIVSVGASMTEEKEFDIDCLAMLGEMDLELRKIPSVNLRETLDESLPELFWIEGVFGLVRINHEENGILLGKSTHFHCLHALGDERYLALLANSVYFTSGFDQITQHAYGAACDFAITAKLLVRLIFCEKNYPVAAPLLIYKTGSIVGYL